MPNVRSITVCDTTSDARPAAVVEDVSAQAAAMALGLFVACLGLLLAAMAWVSWHTLALERERETAAREADQQERVRLALWRLDFQASALMIRENARPPYDFRPFHSPEGLVNKAYDNVAKGEVLVPSPLLSEVPEHVLLYFQMDTRGQVLSPQVPQNDERTLALQRVVRAVVFISASISAVLALVVIGGAPCW